MTFRSLRFLWLPSLFLILEAVKAEAPVELIATVQGIEKQPQPFPPEIGVWLKIQSPQTLKGIVFVLNAGLANSAVVESRFPQGITFSLLVPESLTAGIWRVKRYSDQMTRPGVMMIATDLAQLPYVDLARLSAPPKQVLPSK